MYGENIINNALNLSVAKIIREDRSRFESKLKNAIKFTRKKGGILDFPDDFSIHTTEASLEHYSMDIYVADDIRKTAKELADFVFEGDPYTHVVNSIPAKEYTLVVDTRPIIRVRLLENRGYIPVLGSSVFDHNPIKRLGLDIKLLQLYGKLCNPEFAEEWTTLFVKEKNVRHKFLDEVNEKITGGSDSAADTGNKVDYTKYILDDFIPKGERVLVGSLAIRKNISRIQYFTTNNIHDELEELEEIGKRCDYNVKGHITSMKIPGFHEYVKLTIKDEQNVSIMDVFTAGIELIPYEYSTHTWLNPNIKVGSPFLLMRCFVLDVVTMQLLSTKLGNDLIQKYISNITKNIKIVGDTLDKTFDLSVKQKYVGSYLDPIIKWKREKQQLQKKFKQYRDYVPYYPIIKENAS